jgi:glucokinase
VITKTNDTRRKIMKNDNTKLDVGVDVGATSWKLAVAQGNTLVSSRKSGSTGRQYTAEELVQAITPAIAETIQEVGTSLSQAKVGLCLPGLITREGEVKNVPNFPHFRNIPLADMLHERLKVPVFVVNDAKAAGLAEYLYGAGHGWQKMVYFTVSTGIGSCLIDEGKVIFGATDTAGEFGHTTLNWMAPVMCGCGVPGCLESLASGSAIGRMGQENIETTTSDLYEYTKQRGLGHSNPLTGEDVANAAKDGSKAAQSIIDTAAEKFGFGLVNIIHTLNPEGIVVGGSIALEIPGYLERATSIVNRYAMKLPREAVTIVPASHRQNSGIIGAAAAAEYFANQRSL